MPALEIREARDRDAEAVARIHVSAWRTTYRGLLPDRMLDDLDEANRAAMWSSVIAEAPSRGRVLVAAVNGKLVGFASFGRERTADMRYDAELYAIYVLEAHQRAGLGRLLLDAAARALLHDGYHSMLVWVLERNPACTFYERLGGRSIGTKQERLGDVDIVERSYGWDDLRALLATDRG